MPCLSRCGATATGCWPRASTSRRPSSFKLHPHDFRAQPLGQPCSSPPASHQSGPRPPSSQGPVTVGGRGAASPLAKRREGGEAPDHRRPDRRRGRTGSASDPCCRGRSRKPRRLRGWRFTRTGHLPLGTAAAAAGLPAARGSAAQARPQSSSRPAGKTARGSRVHPRSSRCARTARGGACASSGRRPQGCRAGRARPGGLHHGQGDRAAERDHWPRRHPDEHVIERQVLAAGVSQAVRIACVATAGDGRLALVRTNRDGAQGPGEQRLDLLRSWPRAAAPGAARRAARSTRPACPGRSACVGQQRPARGSPRPPGWRCARRSLDPEQCLILLREKGETVRWQPVSPTLMAALLGHAEQRHAAPDGSCCPTATAAA